MADMTIHVRDDERSFDPLAIQVTKGSDDLVVHVDQTVPGLMPQYSAFRYSVSGGMEVLMCINGDCGCPGR